MALLGDIYRELSDQDAARDWYERTVALRRQLADAMGQAWIHERLARLHLEAGLTDLARDQARHRRRI